MTPGFYQDYSYHIYLSNDFHKISMNANIMKMQIFN